MGESVVSVMLSVPFLDRLRKPAGNHCFSAAGVMFAGAKFASIRGVPFSVCIARFGRNLDGTPFVAPARRQAP